jgi:signal transduction histidine kinase
VTVEIRFDSSFGLRLADDGVGIAPGVAASRGRDGHFGLVGMAERARKLRARLCVEPLADGGTEVVLSVPGAIAYKRDERRPFGRFGR